MRVLMDYEHTHYHRAHRLFFVLKIPNLFQCLSVTLLYHNRKAGLRASGVLFIFWLLLILAGLPQLRSEIVLHKKAEEDENVRYVFISYLIYYPLIVLMFILNCFADMAPKVTPYKFEKVITV